MTWTRLAASLLIAALTLAGVTHWRASAREAAAEADFPPTGAFVTVDGRRLHYEIAGNGPDLVLIHGASGSLRDMTFGLRDRLTDRFRVIAVDRPGLGHSDSLEETSLVAQARHIKAGLAQLVVAAFARHATGLGQWNQVGHGNLHLVLTEQCAGRCINRMSG